MNTQIATTGLVPLTINSKETFEGRPELGGVPWDLTGGTAVLRLADPAGNIIVISGTVGGPWVQAAWIVTGLVGQWTRAWDITDLSGLRQVSRPIPFSVVSSPV